MRPTWRPSIFTPDRILRLALLAVSAAVALAAAPAVTLSATPALYHGTDPARLCAKATQRWEKIAQIPTNLLTAISFAESGRWSEAQRSMHAWPWTVTSGGPGKYFASKTEAMAEVRRLQAKDVQNIDVGCMQVNLHFHGQNFDSLSAAFDPDINTAYAAKYLKQMRDGAGSWAEAAGYYHSMTPERTSIYRARVEKFWAEIGNDGSDTQIASAEPNHPAPLPPIAYEPIDRQRTDALNARFKTLRAAARRMREDLDPELRRQQQVEAWRDARSRNVNLNQLVAGRQAELSAKRERELKAATATGDKTSHFADSRRQQIDRWRLRVAVNGPTDGQQ